MRKEKVKYRLGVNQEGVGGESSERDLVAISASAKGGGRWERDWFFDCCMGRLGWEFWSTSTTSSLRLLDVDNISLTFFKKKLYFRFIFSVSMCYAINNHPLPLIPPMSPTRDILSCLMSFPLKARDLIHNTSYKHKVILNKLNLICFV